MKKHIIIEIDELLLKAIEQEQKNLLSESIDETITVLISTSLCRLGKQRILKKRLLSKKENRK